MPYLLQQHGEVGHESKDALISDRAFRYWRDADTYTHLGLEDATDELKRMEELADARKELEKVKGENTVSQKMFQVI